MICLPFFRFVNSYTFPGTNFFPLLPALFYMFINLFIPYFLVFVAGTLAFSLFDYLKRLIFNSIIIVIIEKALGKKCEEKSSARIIEAIYISGDEYDIRDARFPK